MNRKILIVFAPVLILAGLLGFLVPERYALMSGAPAYNVFHIVFGVLGCLLAWKRSESLARGFNLSFGLIDIYQAVASPLALFPIQYFHWTRADDVLHWLLGAILVGAALRR